MTNKLLDILGILFLFVGFILAFLPHVFHTRIGLDDSISHTKHVIYGMALVVTALAILTYNNNVLKTIDRKKI